jgi:hypothetical protein
MDTDRIRLSGQYNSLIHSAPVIPSTHSGSIAVSRTIHPRPRSLAMGPDRIRLNGQYHSLNRSSPIMQTMLSRTTAVSLILHSDPRSLVMDSDRIRRNGQYNSYSLSPPCIYSAMPSHNLSNPSSHHHSLIRPNTNPNFQVITPTPKHLRPISTLRPNHWRQLLRTYPDKDFPHLLAGIAKFGARIGYEGPFIRIHGPNHASAYRISNDITQNIISELSAGRLIEVNSLPQFYVISPLGAVEKKTNGIHTGWRRIHDLSYPHTYSVNDGIPQYYGSLLYQTLDDAVNLIATHGPNTILRKRDLKDAFRMIPVSPYDYWFLLFEWYGRIYVDIFLPFGLRTSPFIFNLFAEGLHWILHHVYHRELVHYLDDFLHVNDPDPEFFGVLAKYLGLFEKSSKREDGHRVIFLGIEIDTTTMELRLLRTNMIAPFRQYRVSYIYPQSLQHLLRNSWVSYHSVPEWFPLVVPFYAISSISSASSIIFIPVPFIASIPMLDAI